MKWTKLLWSFALIGFLVLLLAVNSSRATDKLGPGFAFFAYMIFMWVAISIFGFIILLLRLFRIIEYRDSFLYIVAGTGSVIFGGLGLMAIFISKTRGNVFPYVAAFDLNILFSAFVFWEAFIKKKSPRDDKKG
jgi:hypothetical protein